MFKKFRFLTSDKYVPSDFSELRYLGINLIPVLDEEGRIVKIINLEKQKTILPLDAVIMAGGRGERLSPLTDNTPKPLLKIAGKPIIEYNLDLLTSYGINNINITLKYLGKQIEEHLGNGNDRDLRIKYYTETSALGTIGAVSMIKDFSYDNVIIMNSDLLTTIDLESFYNHFTNEKADMAVASIPYDVSIPYAVLKCSGPNISNIDEKPVFTYYSNAGIYIVKREMLKLIKENERLDATDFVDMLIKKDYKVVHFPIREYWLDIGKHDDFTKAQADVKHLKF
jgi:NDP-sugar pyrophosphorylase family protein